MEKKRQSKQLLCEGSVANCTGPLSFHLVGDATLLPKVRKGESLLDNTCYVNYGRGGYNKDVPPRNTKRRTSEVGWDKILPGTDVPEAQLTSPEPIIVYEDVQNTNFELIGHWYGSPSLQGADNVDTTTEDYTTTDVAEKPCLAENYTMFRTETEPSFALDRFLSDTAPWSIFNVRSIQAKDSVSNPRHGP